MNQADPKAVLVTGGAGYIGSHAVKALALAGYDVCVLSLIHISEPTRPY